jgi:hypothetical protein
MINYFQKGDNMPEQVNYNAEKIEQLIKKVNALELSGVGQNNMYVQGLKCVKLANVSYTDFYNGYNNLTSDFTIFGIRFIDFNIIVNEIGLTTTTDTLKETPEIEITEATETFNDTVLSSVLKNGYLWNVAGDKIKYEFNGYETNYSGSYSISLYDNKLTLDGVKNATYNTDTPSITNVFSKVAGDFVINNITAEIFYFDTQAVEELAQSLQSLDERVTELENDSPIDVSELANRVTICENDIDSIGGTLTTYGLRFIDIENDIDSLEAIVGDSNSGLIKDVADLETVVGDSNSGLIKDVEDLKNDKLDWDSLNPNEFDVNSYEKISVNPNIPLTLTGDELRTYYNQVISLEQYNDYINEKTVLCNEDESNNTFFVAGHLYKITSETVTDDTVRVLIDDITAGGGSYSLGFTEIVDFSSAQSIADIYNLINNNLNIILSTIANNGIVRLKIKYSIQKQCSIPSFLVDLTNNSVTQSSTFDIFNVPADSYIYLRISRISINNGYIHLFGETENLYLSGAGSGDYSTDVRIDNNSIYWDFNRINNMYKYSSSSLLYYTSGNLYSANITDIADISIEKLDLISS